MFLSLRQQDMTTLFHVLQEHFPQYGILHRVPFGALPSVPLPFLRPMLCDSCCHVATLCMDHYGAGIMETLQGIPDGTQDGLALRGIVILCDLRGSSVVASVLALGPPYLHYPSGALCRSPESRAYKDIHYFHFIFQNQHLLTLLGGFFRSVVFNRINV